MNKTVSINKLRDHLRDGMTILMGGFGLCGIPEKAIAEILESNVRNLTIVSNNGGVDDFGIGLLIGNGQVSKLIASYIGENKTLEQKCIDGSLEVELTPQGTLAEKMRAGGCGIPAFYTPTGVATQVAEGKETRVFNGREYLLEHAIRGDLGLVKAHRADLHGNLTYRKTARNFNPLVAPACDIVFAEVEEIVEPGNIDPEHIVTPGVFVNYICQGESYVKPIEKRTYRSAHS